MTKPGSHDNFFMRHAFLQAQIALSMGEVPIGAVIVCEEKIIAKAYNQCQLLNDVTAHAEMLAITSAANHLGAKYLKKCTLYVTLEPCIMCAGALFWSQIDRLVFAVADPGRGYSKQGVSVLHPKTKVLSGTLHDECKLLLDDFFHNLRN